MEDKAAVFGIYPDAGKAEQAVSLPKSSLFPSDSLSILLPDHESQEKFAHEKHTKAPEEATAGAITGGALGGLIGLMAGAGAPFTFPGVGLLSAAVPIAGALAGLGAGGAGGGILGALIGMGSQNTKPNATTTSCAEAVSCSPSTVTPRTRFKPPKYC